MVTCEGGVGEKRWFVFRFGGIQTDVLTDSSRRVYQSSGQLFNRDFQSSEEVTVFCEDEDLSTVFTTLTEGALLIQTLLSPV